MRAIRRITALTLCIILTVLTQSQTIRAAAAPADNRPNYTIYVNRALNCVTVYTPDEQGNPVPVKSMVCSCGRKGHGTPRGKFRTSDYYDWRQMIDGSYGRYAVRFNKKILFHSVPYTRRSPDTLEWDQYNLLGQSASLGCVRLSVADAKWIYDNCKPGTEVIVYADEENAGALGKPANRVIDPNAPERGWDPTDASDGNPWHAVQVAQNREQQDENA